MTLLRGERLHSAIEVNWNEKIWFNKGSSVNDIKRRKGSNILWQLIKKRDDGDIKSCPKLRDVIHGRPLTSLVILHLVFLLLVQLHKTWSTFNRRQIWNVWAKKEVSYDFDNFDLHVQITSFQNYRRSMLFAVNRVHQITSNNEGALYRHKKNVSPISSFQAQFDHKTANKIVNNKGRLNCHNACYVCSLRGNFSFCSFSLILRKDPWRFRRLGTTFQNDIWKVWSRSSIPLNVQVTNWILHWSFSPRTRS